MIRFLTAKIHFYVCTIIIIFSKIAVFRNQKEIEKYREKCKMFNWSSQGLWHSRYIL